MSYRIYKNDDDKITVVYWSYNYYTDRCLRDKYDDPMDFDTEYEAKKYINENFKKEFIDEDALIDDVEDFFKKARKEKEDDWG